MCISPFVCEDGNGGFKQTIFYIKNEII